MAKITIFGLAGTGTSTVGKALAEKLGYKFISSGNMLRERARNMGLSLSELHERARTDSKFDKELDEEIKNIGEKNDSIVVESRLAWHFIPDSIKIKLTCDFETRVKRLVERDGLSMEAGKAHVLKREKVDDERYTSIYGIENINGDNHFDLTVDTTEITPTQIVNQIISFIKKVQ